MLGKLRERQKHERPSMGLRMRQNDTIWTAAGLRRRTIWPLEAENAPTHGDNIDVQTSRPPSRADPPSGQTLDPVTQPNELHGTHMSLAYDNSILKIRLTDERQTRRLIDSGHRPDLKTMLRKHVDSCHKSATRGAPGTCDIRSHCQNCGLATIQGHKRFSQSLGCPNVVFAPL